MSTIRNIPIHLRFLTLVLLLPSLGNASSEAVTSDIETYNEGCELYRAKDFQGAENLFAEAVAQTDSEKLKQQALYNQGTAMMAGTAAGQITNRLEAVAQAITLFEQAIELGPDDLDAKQNLERALHWMISGRLKEATRLVNEADQMLTQNQAKSAKENYETAKKTVDPVQEDFSPNHKAIQPLIDHADGQLQMLEQAVEMTRDEMNTAKKAIDIYEYKLAADIMLADKPERLWAFDIDQELAQEFQQMVQNNQNVINIVYPPNPLTP